MKIKLSATFEGKCLVCGNKTIVFRAGDEDDKKVVTICKECADKMADKTTEEVIEEYGTTDDEAFTEGVKFERGNVAG
jgi:transcription elongation factor Elf1